MASKVERLEDGFGVWSWYGSNENDGAFEPLPIMTRTAAQAIADEINRPDARDFSASPCDHLRD